MIIELKNNTNAAALAAAHQAFHILYLGKDYLITGSGVKEVPAALQVALQEGSVAQDQVADLSAAALRFWTHVSAQQLDEGVLEEFNEQRIIADINQMKQPDKVWVKAHEVVVIDFKTGLRQDNHMQQIIAYAGLLQTIFALPVRPILYYTQLDLFLEL